MTDRGEGISWGVFMKKRVLMVDDNADMIELVKLQLETLGFEVTVATNGIEAVEKAASQIPDLIVMDIILPKMDGLQASALIRHNPKTRHIPILAATALCRDSDRNSCLASGCNDHIAKPFTHRELGDRINILLKDA
jgi:CheY-like chemotaxis protein